ncbi:MAG: GAF domain-containing protein [Acidobacteriota bacterium]
MQEQRKTHDEILNRLNRRLRTLYQCNGMFFQADSEQGLLQSICEILVAGDELRLAWIGYCEDDAEKTIRLVAQAGYDFDYLKRITFSWGEQTEAGQGPFGIAVRTGKACWIDDIRTDPRFSPWRVAALDRGYASCISIPLIADGMRRATVDLRGTLNLYSGECNAFDESAVEHYTGLAASLTYAVSALRSHLAEDLTYGVTALRTSEERKHAEERVREQEIELRQVLDLAPQHVAVVNSDGSCIYLNQAGLDYHGITLEEWRSSDLRRFLHPGDLERIAIGTQGRFLGGSPREIEARLQRNDGKYRWFLGRSSPVRDEQGRITRWYVASTDIEDRKQAETLLAGEKRLLEMIARGDSLAVILDALCRLVEDLASGSLTSILLLDAKANRLRHGAAPSLPTNYTEAIDGSVIGPSVGSCGTAAYRAEPVNVSDIATDPLWADYRDLALAHGLRACWSTPILSSAGRVLGTFAIYYREPRSPTPPEHNVIEQITHLASIAIERKQAEEVLREQARLLDLTHDTVFVRDMSDVITYWNRGAEELYGWTREHALDKVSHQLTQTIFPAPLEEINAELLRTGRWEGELIHTKRDGTQVVVVSRWSLQRDEQGLPAAILETNNDITERKRAEEALRSAQAELAHVTRVTTLGEMTASIAHEINQPLAAVVTNGSACLRWLMGESPNLEEAREASKRVIRDGNRAGEVIARIRALMQKTETQKAQLDINEAIQEIVLLTQNEAARKGVRLRLELSANLPPVFGDRVQLQQVALNLVMNGVEAMAAVRDRPRELVICSRTHESDHVLVAVQDCGVGIDQEDLEKIFTAFYTTKPQGMGMGLAISRSIIEVHGGRLWATLNEVAGATMQFTLPLSES